jgi:hypothetical protein
LFALFTIVNGSCSGRPNIAIFVFYDENLRRHIFSAVFISMAAGPE